MKQVYARRLGKAQVKTGKALTVFEKARVRLEKETAQLHCVVDDIDNEIQELRALRDKAVTEANKNDSKLVKLLEFLGFTD